MSRVLVFGTFDLFHKGHEFFLSQARLFGSELYAVIALDETVKTIKSRLPVHSQDVRLRSVSAHVDKAVLGRRGDKYAIIEEIRPQVIVLGYDQSFFVDKLEGELERRGVDCVIVRVSESYLPHIFKSSLLREKQ